MDVDFDYEIQSGAEIAQDISYQLADRERSKAGGAEAGTRIRKRLEELDATVKRLEGALVDMEVGRGGASSGGAVVNARALAQRREAVKKLAIEARRLREREHASPFSSDRDALLSAGTGKSYGRESELTRDLTTQEMVARSNLEIKAQDVVLEKMSRSLDTLKTMGGAIRDETALQMVRSKQSVERGEPLMRRRAAPVWGSHRPSIPSAVVLGHLPLARGWRRTSCSMYLRRQPPPSLVPFPLFLPAFVAPLTAAPPGRHGRGD